jgi:hypothetical protein
VGRGGNAAGNCLAIGSAHNTLLIKAVSSGLEVWSHTSDTNVSVSTERGAWLVSDAGGYRSTKQATKENRPCVIGKACSGTARD